MVIHVSEIVSQGREQGRKHVGWKKRKEEGDISGKYMKARHPGPRGWESMGVGWWRKGTSWGKETHSCGTQRGSPWRSFNERKEVAKGTASEPCIQGGCIQRCHKPVIGAPGGEGRGNEEEKGLNRQWWKSMAIVTRYLGMGNPKCLEIKQHNCISFLSLVKLS